MKPYKKILIIANLVVLITILGIYFSPDIVGKRFKDRIHTETNFEINDTPIYLNEINNDLYQNILDYKHSDNIFEEQILNKSDTDTYKILETTVDNYKVYLLVVYNPANVRLMTSARLNTNSNSGKENVLTMTKRYGAVAGVNAGGFFDNGKQSNDTPIGYIIQDNKIIWDYSNNRKRNIIGFDNNNKLVMLKGVTGQEAIEQNVKDGIEFGPFLIVNGEITNEAKRMTGVAARSIIAQREDGIVLFLVTDGGSYIGPNTASLLSILKNYGAYNAANLDGGASSQLVAGEKLYTRTSDNSGYVVEKGRRVITSWGIVAD